MAKLEKLSNKKLQQLLIKDLYGYRKNWYERYTKNHSESAWNEFTKAKKLIKQIENWVDQSEENWKMLRKGKHTYMDFVMITLKQELGLL